MLMVSENLYLLYQTSMLKISTFTLVPWPQKESATQRRLQQVGRMTSPACKM